MAAPRRAWLSSLPCSPSTSRPSHAFMKFPLINSPSMSKQPAPNGHSLPQHATRPAEEKQPNEHEGLVENEAPHEANDEVHELAMTPSTNIPQIMMM